MRTIRVTPTEIRGCYGFGLYVYKDGFTLAFGKRGLFFGWDLEIKQSHEVQVGEREKK